MNERIVMELGTKRLLIGSSSGQPGVLELTAASGYYLDWICWESTVDGKLEICYGPLPEEGDTSPAVAGMFLMSRSRTGGVYSSSSDISVPGWKVPTMHTDEVAQDSRWIRWRADRSLGVIGIAMAWLST